MVRPGVFLAKGAAELLRATELGIEVGLDVAGVVGNPRSLQGVGFLGVEKAMRLDFEDVAAVAHG